MNNKLHLLISLLIFIILTCFIYLYSSYSNEKEKIYFRFNYALNDNEHTEKLSSQYTFVSTCRRFPIYQCLLSDIENLWVPIKTINSHNDISIESRKEYDAEKYYYLFYSLAWDLRKECAYYIAQRDISSNDESKILSAWYTLFFLSKTHGENVYPKDIYINAAIQKAQKENNQKTMGILKEFETQFSDSGILALGSTLEYDSYNNDFSKQIDAASENNFFSWLMRKITK